MRLGLHRGGDHFGLGRLGPAVEDVLARRAVEHRGFLRDHGDPAAQAVLRHAAHVAPADQYPAAFDVVEPEQQADQRRLPCPRGADDAQLLAGADVEIDRFDPAGLAAIGEADMVEADRGGVGFQRHRIGGVGQGMGRAEGAHAVLDLAQVGVDRHQGEADPAGHLGDAERDGPDRGDVAGGRAAPGPEPQHRPGQQRRHQPRHRHQREPEEGRDIAEVERAVAIPRHRRQGHAVFQRVVGEELHRPHVRDRVDHQPRGRRPCRGPRGGALAHLGQPPGDEAQIAHQPQRQKRGDLPVDGDEQRRRGDHRGEREDDGVQPLDGDVHHRPAALHFLLRDAAGEVVVEIGDRLPQRPAVQPGQRQRADIGPDHHGLHRRGRAQHQRPQHHHQQEDADQVERMVGKEPPRGRGEREVDHVAEEDRHHHLDRAGGDRDHRGQRQHRVGPLQAPGQEAPEGLRRRRVGAGEGVDHLCQAVQPDPAGDVHKGHSAASLCGSVPMKPPDCRAQNPA